MAASLRTFISRDRIADRVREIGQATPRDYAPGPVVLVCVLKGACLFASDLLRAIDLPVHLDFVGTSSYGAAQTSSGEVRLTKDLDLTIAGLDVLLVEDIVDTGITRNYLLDMLRQRQPRSLHVVTLLDKPSRRLKPVPIAYIGFEIPNEFVVGYGMDYGELYRNLPEICVLDNAS